MGSDEWEYLQWSIIWVFGPILHWLAVIFLSGSILAGLSAIWMGLLRTLSKR